ncbi:MAG TPA: response regulator/pilus assembly protein [Firmicutes bacterium]|nr:response regulator/pilus assembly protein [Bacillota bacterium]
MQVIRVIIADDLPETRVNVRRMLELAEGFAVVGEAGDGREAVASTRDTMPDCVLMDINMPVMDGIQAAEIITSRFPEVAVVMMSVQGEHEYLRRAMTAGARDYLVKPFTTDELANTVRKACLSLHRRQENHPGAKEDKAEVVAVMGPKGGVGRTTVAVNLALAFTAAGEQSYLLDLNLQFGDAAMSLDVVPGRNLAHLVFDGQPPDLAAVEEILEAHKSGVHLLAGPDRPEEAELIDVSLVDQVLRLMQVMCRRLVVDMPNRMEEMLLPVLDRHPVCVMVITPELATVRNAGQAIRLLRDLEYDIDRLKLVLNRYSPQAPINQATIERNLGLPVFAVIPDDPKAMRTAGTRGEPVVVGQPDSPSGKALAQLAAALLGQEAPAGTAEAAEKSRPRLGLLRREAKLVTS